jgi:hypothetical protein
MGPKFNHHVGHEKTILFLIMFLEENERPFGER